MRPVTWPPQNPAELIVAAAALLVALGVLYRYIVGPLVRLFRKAEKLLETWLGEPARDGLPARPGIVDRLITIENEVKYNGGTRRLVDAVKDVEQAAHRLEGRADTNAAGIAALKDGQADAKAAAEQAKEAAEDARDRAATADTRLTRWVTEGQVREQAYLASLAELGINIPPVPREED